MTDVNITSDTGNFTELNLEINNNDLVNLTKDYEYANEDEILILNKSMTLNGNNHTISINSSIFKIENGNDIFFKNINFYIINNFSINSTSNITFYDCSFQFQNPPQEITTEYSYSLRGNISNDVANLAKTIVGNSKDLEAAKKLAKWVGKNIIHESHNGFYQNASETLRRKLGNCCSQTELFLQMCESIGLNKNHKLYFVHVGTIAFGHRHFFAMIDNLCVDVDARPSNPWGHASMSNGQVYAITEYPILPLQRQYN